MSKALGVVDGAVAGGLFIRDRILSSDVPVSHKDAFTRGGNAAAETATLNWSDDEIRSRLSEFKGLFGGERYIRYSEGEIVYSNLVEFLQSCQRLHSDGLSSDVQEQLRGLSEVADRPTFEAARDRNNRSFVYQAVLAVHAATLMDLPVSLTDEQAQAVATDEDATLVLAGAGTGKTAVIVGKAVHLVRNQGVTQDAPPHEVLLLAFNREAADEMRERLPSDLAEVHVSTFHSFGRRVISETNVAPSISQLATDDFAYRRALTAVIEAMLRDPQTYETVKDFLAYRSAPYRSAFDFRTVDEYEKYVRGIELRTLNGYLVRSFEELVIANFLTEHGVSFHYERPYKVETATKRHQQYKPDFYLPENDIYIEHFAIDRKGRAPEGWNTYTDTIEWKRSIHKQYGTTLIETYSWQWREDTLFETLRVSLEDAGVRMEKRDCAELVIRLARQKILSLADLVKTFLTHAKGARLDVDQMIARSGGGRDGDRAGRFLKVYEHVRSRYEELLANEPAVDFHDLIHRATGLIESGAWESQYRYVLVDEFQDISADRMGLLKVLRRQGVAFFLVGDDWQSIYRFAGSDIRLMRNCHEHLGHIQERHLSQVFRFGERILTLSSAFVQRNPEQTRRTLKPADVSGDLGITVVSDKDPESALLTALEDISSGGNGDSCSVLVLGRYNKSGSTMPSRADSGKFEVSFSTVHRAKGLEADYVVILDLKDRRDGFPSRMEDDPLMNMVLPPISGQAYPLAEERRLFYVALTRAKHGVYLATDAARPSEFVAELENLYPDIRRLGRQPIKCPQCNGGNLVASKSRRTLLCTNRPTCDYMPPICPSCNLGHVIVEEGKSRCLNPTCDRPAQACPSCGRGVLVKRDGRSGSFLACTAYWSEPPCQYTRQLRSRRSRGPVRRSSRRHRA